MGETYRVYDQEGVYFVTFTVHQACQAKGMGVDVFSRATYVEILLANLRYYHTNKGLQIYAYVVSNHCQLIISVKEGNLSNLIRDFKKHTSKVLMKAIEETRRKVGGNGLGFYCERMVKSGFGRMDIMEKKLEPNRFFIAK